MYFCSNQRTYFHLALVLLSCSALSSVLGCRTARTIPPTTTRWQKLGIPQAIGGVTDNLVNRGGKHPGLERKPPLKRIADPSNLESENPAIKAAAEIKKEEDLAKQKIKALKYLVDIGCGCYDKDGKVEAAVLAGLSDCTEDVRLAALDTILELVEDCDSEASYGNCSSKKKKGRLRNRKGGKRFCNLVMGSKDNCTSSGSSSCCGSCCTAKIQERLSEIAYEEKCGCWLEPSPAVREKAKQALCKCPCPSVDCEEDKEPEEAEEPEEPSEEKAEDLPKPEKDPESQDSEEGEEDGEDGEEDSEAEEEEEDASEEEEDESDQSVVDDTVANVNYNSRSVANSRNAVKIIRLQQKQRTSTARPSALPKVIRRVAAHSPNTVVNRYGKMSMGNGRANGIVEFLDPSNDTVLIVFKGSVQPTRDGKITCLIEDTKRPNRKLEIPCTVVHSKPGMLGVKPQNYLGKQQLQPGVHVVLKGLIRRQATPTVPESEIKLISRQSPIGKQRQQPSNPFRTR